MSKSSDSAKLWEIVDNVAEIREISKKAGDILDKEHNISISYHEAIPTIAAVFLNQCCVELSKMKSRGSNVELNLMELLDIGISYRENEDGEKEGNYTPYAIPGRRFKLLVKSDEETEED